MLSPRLRESGRVSLYVTRFCVFFIRGLILATSQWLLYVSMVFLGRTTTGTDKQRKNIWGRIMKTDHQFSISQILLLVAFMVTWLAITVHLGWLSIVFWGLAVLMAAILRPAHQRRRTPESVTDVLSVAVCWAVACGFLGVAFDAGVFGRALSDAFSWVVFGQLAGFYLGLIWVLIILLVRHIERVIGQPGHPVGLSTFGRTSQGRSGRG